MDTRHHPIRDVPYSNTQLFLLLLLLNFFKHFILNSGNYFLFSKRFLFILFHLKFCLVFLESRYGFWNFVLWYMILFFNYLFGFFNCRCDLHYVFGIAWFAPQGYHLVQMRSYKCVWMDVGPSHVLFRVQHGSAWLGGSVDSCAHLQATDDALLRKKVKHVKRNGEILPCLIRQGIQLRIISAHVP